MNYIFIFIIITFSFLNKIILKLKTGIKMLPPGPRPILIFGNLFCKCKNIRSITCIEIQKENKFKLSEEISIYIFMKDFMNLNMEFVND